MIAKTFSTACNKAFAFNAYHETAMPETRIVTKQGCTYVVEEHHRTTCNRSSFERCFIGWVSRLGRQQGLRDRTLCEKSSPISLQVLGTGVVRARPASLPHVDSISPQPSIGRQIDLDSAMARGAEAAQEALLPDTSRLEEMQRAGHGA